MKKINISLIIALSLSALVLLVLLGEGLFSCVFKNALGIPCPFCGLTRAGTNLLQGHIPQAFAFHPLFWLAALDGLAIFGYARGNKKWRKICSIFIIVSLILFIAVWILRMLTVFPGQPPLDFNKNAWILRSGK